MSILGKEEIYIKDDDKNYQVVLSTLSKNLRKKTLVPFLGAGISNSPPSRLPLASGLTAPIIKSMVDSIRNSQIKISNEKDFYTKIIEAIKNQPLEALLDEMIKAHGESALDYLDVLDKRKWNKNHIGLANLVQNNFIDKIITLNFDILIELALESLGLEYYVSHPLSSTNRETIYESSSNNKDGCEIVKPHGSFRIPVENDERNKYIVSTLSLIGDRPDERNVKAFQRILNVNPNLLVAGYSDDDWDISPIFEQNLDRINHITWIVHTNEELVQRSQHKEIIGRMDGKPKWYRMFSSMDNNKWTVLYGDISKLIQDLNINLNIKYKFPSTKSSIIKPNVEPFYQNPNTTCLAVVSLLRDPELGLVRPIINYLKTCGDIINNNEQYSLLIGKSAWQYHIDGEFEKSIGEHKKFLKLNIKLNSFDLKNEAQKYISIGYTYLGLLKPHIFAKFRRILWVPIRLILVAWYFRKGYKLAEKNNNLRQQAIIIYYLTDLIHNWLSIFFIFGPKVIRIFALLFRLVGFAYNYVNKKYKGKLDWEYFWLRHQEVNILSRTKINAVYFNKNINDIEHYFQSTQQIGHLRNVLLSKALWFHYEHPKDKNKLKELFDKATDYGGGKEGITRTGWRRNILFRRYFFPEDYSFTTSVKDLIQYI